ncbi:hypothetical protein Cgig2_013463 [Carnegiea gigantea]|uniref:Uncharacterized protein n=1 Tax=Carnegiea gigantea TaxID=171969 RepID=A0A9Q1QBW0_9CARY|nr:hypothetical protein Cgig2_013463 [Carnegiea gigantea]
MSTDGNCRIGEGEANVSVSEKNDVGCGSNGGLAEETNPDLLKNTPTNIRRLEDEIEQLRVDRSTLPRQEALLMVVMLDGTFARYLWGSMSWQPLFAALRLLVKENIFGLREEELLSYWWKEYAECSEGPKGRTSSSTASDLREDPQTSELYAV